jgi:hypothetical protein
VAVALPTGNTFVAGTNQLVVVTFASPIVTSPTSTTINFGDSPVQRALSDVFGKPLSATFNPGTVILPPSQLEGDVFPRPNGEEQLTVSDWVLIGRYVARLDSPTNALEFQKADCAPRETLGDGALTVSDWVQAGRYVAGLDPVTRVGGPTNEVPSAVTLTAAPAVTRKIMSSNRQVRLAAPVLAQSQTGAVMVELESLGNENALSFSLSFDQTRLVFVSATAAGSATGAILNINANQATQGRLGLVLALNANQSFAAGSKQAIQLNFRASPSGSGNVPLMFVDQPVPRGLSDPNASVLDADYVNATVVINPAPSLRIVTTGASFNLSWPTSAVGFVLQESSDVRLAATSWTAVVTSPVIANGENVVSVPTGATNRFYRLNHP